MLYNVFFYAKGEPKTIARDSCSEVGIKFMVEKCAKLADKFKTNVVVEFKPRSWFFEFDKNGEQVFDVPKGVPEGIDVKPDIPVIEVVANCTDGAVPEHPSIFADPAACTSGG